MSKDTPPISQYVSEFNLIDVFSTIPTKLNFEYENINTRVCTNLISKLLISNKNITATVNNFNIEEHDLDAIIIASNENKNLNKVIISLNKSHPEYTLSTVTPSINTPLPMPVDPTIPLLPTPTPLPNIPEFIPSTANPIVYTITGVAPVYPVVPPTDGGGVIILGGDGAITPTIPPFIPPDEVDGEVLPPIKTTERRNLGCPANHIGSIVEERIKTVYQGSGRITYTDWKVVLNGCVYVPPPPPHPPSPSPSPASPAPGQQFTDSVTVFICNSSDSGYYTPSPEIPVSIRNKLINTYRVLPNHLGRCPEYSGYSYWLNTMASMKANEAPGHAWDDYYPLFLHHIENSAAQFTRQQQLDGANAACMTAAKKLYGASVRASYVDGSGNKCKII